MQCWCSHSQNFVYVTRSLPTVQKQYGMTEEDVGGGKTFPEETQKKERGGHWRAGGRI